MSKGQSCPRCPRQQRAGGAAAPAAPVAPAPLDTIVSYPVFFVYVFIMTVILAIFMRKFVVRRCYGTAIYCVKKYFDFVVSDDIFVDSRLFYCRLSTFYSRLSTFYSRLSTFTLDSRPLLSTLDLYSRPSTFRYTQI
jgi:hypothetical protein